MRTHVLIKLTLAAICLSATAAAHAQAGTATLIIKRGPSGVTAVRFSSKAECERVLAAMNVQEEREYQSILNRPTQPNVYNIPAPKMWGYCVGA
jgi:hypothetical protein